MDVRRGEDLGVARRVRIAGEGQCVARTRCLASEVGAADEYGTLCRWEPPQRTIDAPDNRSVDHRAPP